MSPATRVLILGSLPGEASLAAHRYYAHPQNQFWRLTGGLIGVDLPALDYPILLETLLKRGIGLWDVIATATRCGSLDSALRDVTGNPLNDLIATLPGLRAIGFNGKTAARIGRKALGETALALHDLPSSSAAHARLSLAGKAEIWGQLREYLS